MYERNNYVTRFTTWTAPASHCGLTRTMEEIRGEQERTRQILDQRDKFLAKDVCCAA